MKKIKKKAELYSSGLIDQFLNDISPEEYERTKKRMLLAARIDDAIKAKGWKKKDLADALNKQPSEISKWLSGVHNFTSDTLWDIEDILNIKIINVSENDTIVVQKFYISGSSKVSKESKSNYAYQNYNKLIPVMEQKIEYGQTN